MKRPGIFIQTNDKQRIGAVVSAYSMKRNSKRSADFDVTVMRVEDYPFFRAHDGETYKRHGVERVWNNNDLQSFTLTRFLPPSLMGFEGRGVVVDPDVFAIGDVWELISRDMGNHAIMCRQLPFKRQGYATSVMLLDNARLKHWEVEQGFHDLFTGKRDYHDWISLKLEPAGSIGLLEPEWNDLDKLTPATKMIHNTRRRTQPWKTGLPVDYTPTEFLPVIGFLMRARRKVFGEYGALGKYRRHPDRNQENLFFGLLRECLEKGFVSEEQVKEAMARNYVRHDAFDVISKVPPLKQAA